jgi:UDP-glucose 4-epimerase
MKQKKDTLKMKRFVITGADGFIGKYLITALSRKYPDCEIIKITRRKKENVDKNSILMDLQDIIDPNSITGRCDTFFHLASVIPNHGLDPNINLIFDNVKISENVLKLCGFLKPKRLIVASSISVYPPDISDILLETILPLPILPYGIGKLASEHILSYARNFGSKVSFLRISSVYGHHMSESTIIPYFINNCLKSVPLSLYGKGERKQDFVHVLDVVSAFLKADEKNADGVYNIASGQSTTMLQLALEITKQHGWENTINFDPNQKEQQSSVQVDISHASKKLDFIPEYNIAKGIKNYHDLWL